MRVSPPSNTPSDSYLRGALAITGTAVGVLAIALLGLPWLEGRAAFAALALGVGIVWFTMLVALAAATVAMRVEPESAAPVLCGLAGFRMLSCAGAVALLGRLTPLALGPLALGVLAAYIPSLAVETAILVRAAVGAADSRSNP